MDYELIENLSDEQINKLYQDDINGDLDEKLSLGKVPFYCYVAQYVENIIEREVYKNYNLRSNQGKYYTGQHYKSAFAEFHFSVHNSNYITCPELSYCEDRLKLFSYKAPNTPYINNSDAIQYHNVVAALGPLVYYEARYYTVPNPPTTVEYKPTDIYNTNVVNIFKYLYGYDFQIDGYIYPVLPIQIASRAQYYIITYEKHYFGNQQWALGYFYRIRAAYEYGSMNFDNITYNSQDNELNAYFNGFNQHKFYSKITMYGIHRNYDGAYFYFYRYEHIPHNMDIKVYAVCRR